MRTIRFILTLLLLTGSMATFSQFNPVQNLYFQQGYEYGNTLCPSYNCYIFSWETPAGSNDTLLGYNIYQNRNLYRFTPETSASCSGYVPCNYEDFYNAIPFWLTVKAVYNSDSAESVAVDSAFVDGLLIKIEEIKRDEFALLKNPVKTGENISLLIPGQQSDNCIVQIISMNGQVMKEYRLSKISGSMISISSNHLTRGQYFVNLKADNKRLTTKLILE